MLFRSLTNKAGGQILVESGTDGVVFAAASTGPFAGVLNAMTFRFLAPIRRAIPPLGGVLDLSPLIVIVLAQLVLMLPVAWLEQAVGQLLR